MGELKLSVKNIKRKGYLLTEIIVSIAVLGVLILAFTVSLNGFGRFNRVQLVRQQCTAAAQAQLDSIAATGKPIPDEDFKRLWPRLSVSIKQSDGIGQWQGLKLLEVETGGMAFSHPVKIQLYRYMAAESLSIEQEL
jgi:hypothetical protein